MLCKFIIDNLYNTLILTYIRHKKYYMQLHIIHIIY